jgi:hypothetical protein
MGEKRNAQRPVVGKPEERNHSQNLDVDEKIILKFT